MNNPAFLFARVGFVSGILSGVTTQMGLGLVAPGLIFGIAIAYTANLIFPLRWVRVLGIIVGSGFAYFAAVATGALMVRYIPISNSRAIGCLIFMFAGLIGGTLLSLVVIPALRLVPRGVSAIALALAGAGLGYIQLFLGVTLRDDVGLQAPLPHIVGFIVWQAGVSAVIGAGLRGAERKP